MRAAPSSLFALLPGHAGTRIALPAPERLAAVATVLCVYPRRQRDALAGWLAARDARRLDEGGYDGGACEALSFRDAAGRECWRLYLLADSDFLAWDDAAAALSPVPAHAGAWAAAARWLRRLRGGWRAQALRLSVLRDEAGHCVLLADAAALSPLGLTQARRMAAAAGARLDERAHSCCCLTSASAPAIRH